MPSSIGSHPPFLLRHCGHFIQPQSTCAYSAECVEYEFCELRLLGILGSSLSSCAARRHLRIHHEALEDGVGDASLEAPQGLLARFALIYLLAVVGTAPSVRPGLAYRDHVQSVVELAVAGQRKPVAHRLAAGGFERSRA